MQVTSPFTDPFEAALGERIWHVGVDVVFASGKRANNKIDWEGLFLWEEATADPRHPRNFALTPAGKLVVQQVAEMIEPFQPDLLVGVPTGGQRFAMVIGKELGVDVARLKKKMNKPGLKTYDYETPDDQAKIAKSTRLKLIEDTTTEFTSLYGAVQLIKEAEGEREVEVTALHRRDDGSSERDLDIEVEWLVPDAPIPNIVTADHPTFRRYGHLAIGSL